MPGIRWDIPGAGIISRFTHFTLLHREVTFVHFAPGEAMLNTFSSWRAFRIFLNEAWDFFWVSSTF